MSARVVIPLLPLIAMLLVAATIDLRRRRIPNWLTASMALSGLAQSFAAHHTVGPASSALGMLVGFALPLVLMILNAVGGGDVKLLAAVGAWVGPVNVLLVFLLKDVVGLVLVLGQAAWQRRLGALARNSTVVALNLVHIRHVGVETVQQTGLSCRSVDKPLPMAVPVLIALVALALAHPGGFLR
jgi:prepilin peptidase CpaA